MNAVTGKQNKPHKQSGLEGIASSFLGGGPHGGGGGGHSGGQGGGGLAGQLMGSLLGGGKPNKHSTSAGQYGGGGPGDYGSASSVGGGSGGGHGQSGGLMGMASGCLGGNHGGGVRFSPSPHFARDLLTSSTLSKIPIMGTPPATARAVGVTRVKRHPLLTILRVKHHCHHQ